MPPLRLGALALLILLALSMGCQEPVGPVSLKGTFRATEANGVPLPAPVLSANFTGGTLSLYAATLSFRASDSLVLVAEIGSSPDQVISDTLRATYTVSGDTLTVSRNAQRSGYSRIVGPIVRKANGSIQVPMEQYRSLIGGFVTIPVDISFAR